MHLLPGTQSAEVRQNPLYWQIRLAKETLADDGFKLGFAVGLAVGSAIGLADGRFVGVVEG